MGDRESRVVVGTLVTGFFAIDTAQHVEGSKLRDRVSPVFHTQAEVRRWIRENPR